MPHLEATERDIQRISRSATLIANLHGVLLPFPTPFNSNACADTLALSRNLSKWSQAGIAGYVALGSTGERVHLNESEYVKLVETARAGVSSKTAFIVGAGQL